MSAENSSTAPSGEQDIDLMKQQVTEMEAEAAKLREMQAEIDKTEQELAESKEEVDARSVFVGNVDFSSTPEELQAHFASTGTINRVTILVDKYTNHPKGYAYIEFAEPSLVTNALVLNDSVFKGRNIKVTPKRTNLPYYMRYRGGGRGRGRGRIFRGYRGSFRSRGRGFYNPY